MISSISSNSADISGEGSDNGSSTAPASLEISAEQEFCLYELDTTDSTSIGLVLRAIYDTGDVHKFVRALERRIAFYDKSILKVCTYHYQGFLDSIKQLAHLNEKCDEIKKIVEDTNAFIQSDSAELLKKGAEIVRYRRLQRNANLAIDQISMCLPALDNYAHLQKLMEEKKYLQALKILEDLEHNHFVELKKYRFAQWMIESVTPMRKEICSRSYSELTDFLELLHSKSQAVGEEAMQHTAAKSQILADINMTDTPTSDSTPKNSAQIYDAPIQLANDGALVKSKDVTGRVRTDLVTKTKTNRTTSGIKSTSDGKNEFSEQDSIDYGPIHRCCQIFNVVDDKESFEVYYRKQRREQASVLIHAPIKTDSISGYVRYLQEVMGFFVVEDRIMQIQPNLVSTAHRNQLWETALQEVVETLSFHFKKFRDEELMFKMKQIILIFILTVKNYGYNTAPLYMLLHNARDQYNEVLMSTFTDSFESALKADNYTPITMTNEREYRVIVDEFPIFRRTTDQEEYPRRFPFSQFVPSVLTQAKSYILRCLCFMENLQLSQSEIKSTICRYTNILLACWSKTLKDFVSSQRRSLIQLVQVTINIGYLERSRKHLEQFISLIVGEGALLESGPTVTLDMRVFGDTRSDVEQLINHALEEKVSAFLEIANYDWELTQVKGIANDYVIDLVNFLRTTFTSFTNLPSTLAKNAFIQTCKHLVDSLHQMLVGPDIRAISMDALEQFSLDVIQCELFSAQRPVADIDDDTLHLIFAPVRQLLDLLLNDDWTTFFAQRGKTNSKYSHVRASSAATLLERLIEFEKKSSGFFGIGRGDRKKLYDAILRKLRALND